MVEPFCGAPTENIYRKIINCTVSYAFECKNMYFDIYSFNTLDCDWSHDAKLFEISKNYCQNTELSNCACFMLQTF